MYPKTTIRFITVQSYNPTIFAAIDRWFREDGLSLASHNHYVEGDKLVEYNGTLKLPKEIVYFVPPSYGEGEHDGVTNYGLQNPRF